MSKILVIEDEPMVRSNLVELLEAEQFVTCSAIDGFDGVRVAQEQLPDLILCDVMMPELDGYDVLQMLRKDPETATIPFIFLTAQAALKEVRQGMNLGADDYLTKPFGRSDLLLAISTRLAKHDRYLQIAEKQFNGFQEKFSFARPDKLFHSLEEITQTVDLFIRDAETIAPADITQLGLDIRGKSQNLQRSIQNLLLYLQLELITHDSQTQQALRSSQTLRPADFIMMFAQQKSKQYQRSRDLQLQIENKPIQVATDDLKKILDEALEFAFSQARPNTDIKISTILQPIEFFINLQFEPVNVAPELIDLIEQAQNLPRSVYEELDPGLGVLLIQRIATLYGGNLMLNFDAVAQCLTLGISLPYAT
jgi:two-component system, sensor histidine kinase and response regulator